MGKIVEKPLISGILVSDQGEGNIPGSGKILLVRDLNGDGKLSFEEYAASGIEKFRKADANGDGLLLAAEFATTAPKVKKIQTASAEKCACSPTQTAAASDD